MYFNRCLKMLRGILKVNEISIGKYIVAKPKNILNFEPNGTRSYFTLYQLCGRYVFEIYSVNSQEPPKTQCEEFLVFILDNRQRAKSRFISNQNHTEGRVQTQHIIFLFEKQCVQNFYKTNEVNTSSEPIRITNYFHLRSRKLKMQTSCNQTSKSKQNIRNIISKYTNSQNNKKPTETSGKNETDTGVMQHFNFFFKW